MSANSFLAFLLLFLNDADAAHGCASWCNAYTCSMEQCSSCSVCHTLADGKFCAAWCNPYTATFEHCHGCGKPTYALSEPLSGPNGTAYCEHRRNPLVDASDVGYDGRTYTYQTDIWIEGTDPHRVFEECVKAVGTHGHPTISWARTAAGGYCNSDCEFYGFSGGIKVDIYTQVGDEPKPSLPLICNARPYEAFFCSVEKDTFYEGVHCTKRPDSSFGTIQDDCLTYAEVTPSWNPDACVEIGFGAETKALLTEAYAADPSSDISERMFGHRDFSDDPAALPVDTPLKGRLSCIADGPNAMATMVEVWYTADADCTAVDPDLTYVEEGLYFKDQYQKEACEELNLLEGGGQRARALVEGGKAARPRRARRGLKQKGESMKFYGHTPISVNV